MPFIDLHKFEGIIVEVVRNAHIADLAVQDNYDPASYSFGRRSFLGRRSFSEGGSEGGLCHDQILIVIEPLIVDKIS